MVRDVPLPPLNPWIDRAMPRLPRLQYPGAIYHVVTPPVMDAGLSFTTTATMNVSLAVWPKNSIAAEMVLDVALVGPAQGRCFAAKEM